jgi:hypothetical protein
MMYNFVAKTRKKNYQERSHMRGRLSRQRLLVLIGKLYRFHACSAVGTHRPGVLYA